ncbi:MAG: CIA30 family protein [Planctomycetota bacterium]
MPTKPSVSSLTLWFCCLALLFSAPIASASEDIGHFSDEAKKAKHWFAVNDTVMGGVSKGRVDLTDDDTLLFTGDLSLKNNGGFASIRTRNTDGILADNNTLHIKLRGDGRTYYLSLRDKNRQMASSHRAPIQTKDGEWMEVSVGLDDFYYTSFGQRIDRPELRPDEVIGIGFTLADKKPGKFKLEIASITASHESAQTEQVADSNDILGLARQAGSFETLLAAIEAAGLSEALTNNEDRITVFAPTDEAFAALPDGTVELLLHPRNKEALRMVLFKHVLAEEFTLEREFHSLAGEAISLKSEGPFTIDDATVTQANLKASNGTIHVIDSVLLPKAMQPNARGEAMRLIETAITHGVPAYNHGDPAKCARIYEAAVAELITHHRAVLGEQAGRMMDLKLKLARDSNDHGANAWTLRAALDYAYEAIGE